MISRLTEYVRDRFGRRRIEQELDEELRFHVDQETDANVARGMSPRAARRAALRDLGGVTQTVEAVRAVRSLGVDALWLDVRYAARVLMRERSFTATAFLTIALLVGGATTVFTLVNSVLLRPLPYPESGRIAMITEVDGHWRALTYDQVERLQRTTDSFEGWGLFRPGYLVMLDRTSENPLYVRDMRVSPGLFPLLGIDVVLGRPLLPDDELDSSPDVGVISYDLWQSRFGGAADVIGKTFDWRPGRILTVVGVSAPGVGVPTDLLDSGPIVWNPIRVSQRSGQSARFVTLARLKADRTLRTANRELAGLQPAGPGGGFNAIGLLDSILGDTQRVLWIFSAAVLAVFFIGVANLVNLQLVRNATRERELGVRSALGAGRWRLVRQLATESLVIAMVGGVAGFVIAMTVVGGIVSTLPPDFPRANQIALDAPVWIFAIALSVVVGLAIGTLPAFRVVRPGLAQRISEGARRATLSHRRARAQRVLIAFETGAALVLLVGASLLINSFGRLITESAGMKEDHLWAVRATLPLRYQSPRDTEYWTNALRLIRELPGVERAAITMNDWGPLDGFDRRYAGLYPEGGAGATAGFALSHREIGPGYFETLGIPIIEGRPILDTDLTTGGNVAVLNQLAASTMWPGQSAIGRHFGGGRQRITIIGLVPDYKLTRLDGDVSMQMYTPYTQSGTPAGAAAILVRARPDARALGERMRGILLSLEKDLASVDVSTMAQVRWQLVASERFRTTALAVFALTATFLSLVGVFGLVAYAVAQRTREIGLRVALGSTYGRVAALMVQQAFVPAAIGIVAGIVGAFLSSRVLAAFLFEIEPTDPATFGVAIVLFLLASAAACLVPALRALKIDPATALRHE